MLEALFGHRDLKMSPRGQREQTVIVSAVGKTLCSSFFLASEEQGTGEWKLCKVSMEHWYKFTSSLTSKLYFNVLRKLRCCCAICTGAVRTGPHPQACKGSWYLRNPPHSPYLCIKSFFFSGFYLPLVYDRLFVFWRLWHQIVVLTTVQLTSVL